MVQYYTNDLTKLECELIWMGILLQRAKIVPLKDKEQVQVKLTMFEECVEYERPRAYQILA